VRSPHEICPPWPLQSPGQACAQLCCSQTPLRWGAPEILWHQGFRPWRGAQEAAVCLGRPCAQVHMVTNPGLKEARQQAHSHSTVRCRTGSQPGSSNSRHSYAPNDRPRFVSPVLQEASTMQQLGKTPTSETQSPRSKPPQGNSTTQVRPSDQPQKPLGARPSSGEQKYG